MCTERTKLCFEALHSTLGYETDRIYYLRMRGRRGFIILFKITEGIYSGSEGDSPRGAKGVYSEGSGGDLFRRVRRGSIERGWRGFIHARERGGRRRRGFIHTREGERRGFIHTREGERMEFIHAKEEVIYSRDGGRGGNLSPRRGLFEEQTDVSGYRFQGVH